MKKYLILVAIGPVQDFIATARRSRDLWFGSWFLSEISKTVARTLVDVNGGRSDSLIFPAASEDDLKQNSAFNSANKILAVIDADPKPIGVRIKVEANARLCEIADEAFRGRTFDVELANKQLADLIELYWVAVEFDGSDASYPAARAKAEFLMAARKNTRDFRSVDWGSRIPKSSLDGKRESVIYDQARRGPSELYRDFKIRKGEQLCGVGLLKRLGVGFAEDGIRLDRIASTSHIAAKPFLDKLTNKAAFEEFKRKLIELGIDHSEFHSVPQYQSHPVFGQADGHLLFEDRMRDYFETDEEIKNAKTILNEFLGTAFGKKGRPEPYYALLAADGDNIGKAIDAQTTPSGHRAFSQALSCFSSQVRTIVNERHKGSLFYSGGDDVLALVPLDTVLGCADELNSEFTRSMAQFVDADGKSPTLSVGIAVAHHLQPLTDALDLARTAEGEAKKVDGKNGLAVIVDKRSGAPRTISGKFPELLQRFRELISLYRTTEVPVQLGYELRDLSRRLEVAGSAAGSLDQIKAAETGRIVRRKLSKRDELKISDQELSGKFKGIFELVGQGDGTERLAEELIVAKLFAGPGDLARTEKEGQEEGGI